MKAAEIINMRHGWKLPEELRESRKQEIVDFCDYTLRKMDKFDIDKYFNLLRRHDYEVNPRYDKSNKLVGYTIGKNASVFKASEVGRKFMVSRLEATWKKMHPKPVQVKMKPAAPVITPSARTARPVTPSPTFTQTKVQPRVQPKPAPSFTIFDINIGNAIKQVEIPNAVKDIFFNEAEVPEDNNTAQKKDIIDVAMLLFAGYVEAATAMSVSCGGGGGSSNDFPKKKDDEDDWKFAHRCVQMAHKACKPKQRSRGFHR